MKRISLCKVDELENESLRKFRVEGRDVVVVRIGDEVFALEDRCSHEDYPLSDGWVDEGKVCCAMHGAQFDPRTGEALTMPAYEDIRAYSVQVEDGTVFIEMEEDG